MGDVRKKCEMRDKKYEIRDKNARCEIGPFPLSKWQTEKRLLMILAYKATWLLMFLCVLCRLW